MTRALSLLSNASASIRLLPIAAVCLLALAAGHAQAVAPADGETAPFVPGEVVIGLKPDAAPASVGIDGSRELRSSADYVTVSVPPGHEEQYIAAMSGRPGVRYAELNYLAQPQIIPNDEKYPLQWDMPMIQAEQAWEGPTLGDGVTIAVVDTGVAFEDYEQFARDPELSKTKFVDPYDATKDDEHPNDENGHGTHVVGTLAQDWNDGIGEAGLAPHAAIMPIKVCLPSGCAGDSIAKGIDWAVDHGADIITISLGGPTMPHVERDALAYAQISNVIVVAAAGNGNAFVGAPALDYPARVDYVIAVGAVDYNGDLTSYSNYGQHEHNDGILLVAPGGDIHSDKNHDGQPDGVLQSTYASSCDGGTPDFTVFKDCYFQGTSMATPHVTGVIALLLSKYPTLSPAQVKTVLTCSARDLGAPGPDLKYGSGLVQAATALRDADMDHVPDCLGPRPQLELTAGNASVEPGGQVTVPIEALAVHGSLASYDLQLKLDTPVATVTGCSVLPQVKCTITDDSTVRITTTGSSTISGVFRVANLTLEAGADAGQAKLVLGASATSADDYDPPPQVTVHSGLLKVEDVPVTISGDVNCDGKVTTLDVTQALGYQIGLSGAFCWRYGDINCNGEIEGADALSILDYLSGLHTALPSGCPDSS